jgi:hypothetical protein
MKPMLALTLVLIASAAEARDRTETCTSHTAMTGTTTTESRAPNRKPTHCESYTNINGSDAFAAHVLLKADGGVLSRCSYSQFLGDGLDEARDAGHAPAKRIGHRVFIAAPELENVFERAAVKLNCEHPGMIYGGESVYNTLLLLRFIIYLLRVRRSSDLL